MPQYRGGSRQNEVAASKRRRDTRTGRQKTKDYLKTGDGTQMGLMVLVIVAIVLLVVPFSGEIMLLVLAWYYRKFADFTKVTFNFPYRLPKLAKAMDGSVLKRHV